MDMTNKKIFFGLTGFLMVGLMFVSDALAQGKFAVITNPACPTLGKDDVKMVFLGYKRSVGGYPVELYISKDENVFSNFVQSVLGI
jgi:UDP-N-acetylmuramyl pentapeptide synthase